MLFGSDEAINTGNIIGLIGGLAALATALGGVIVLIWNTLHKNRQENNSAAISQLEKIADRLQKQSEQQVSHIQELGDAILQLHEEHTNCQVELSEVYGNLDRFCDFCERVATLCRNKGEDPGIPPKKIERKARPDRSAMEFRMRSLRQRTETLSEQNTSISNTIPPKVNGS